MPAPDAIMNKFSSGKLDSTVNAILWLVLLLTIIAVFVPFSPLMSAAGFDPSWVLGMNQATAQRLSFGKEIIYTFGPYASIFTKSYHPSTDFMMVSGTLYLALSYWACIVLLMKKVQWRWVLAFCAVLVLMDSRDQRDSLLFSYPLLVALASFKMMHPEDTMAAVRKYSPLVAALLFAPFGLLTLVKGSVLTLCAAIAVLCSVFFILSKRKFLALICLASPVMSMLLLWIASGQSAATLPDYFINMKPIISGYTEAMGTEGFIHEVFLYLVITSLLLLAVFNERKINSISRLFLLCAFSVFLFIAFKAGYVRHGDHGLIASNALLFGSLFLLFFAESEDWNTKKTFSIAVISVFFYLLTNLTYSIPGVFFQDKLIEKKLDINTPGSLSRYSQALQIYNVIGLESFIQLLIASQNIHLPYSPAWHGIKNRLENKNWPRLDYDAAVTSLREQASFPVLPGTTDIYSFNQAYLIASGNTWSPRPIFQSLGAYTPALAEINRQHLLGNRAPDNIIFRVEPIDGRLPSIEDGASWPILVINYQPSFMENNFLFLRKKESIDEIEEPLNLTSEKHVFGESVNLPHSSQPIFAQIEIKSTILGRLASIFFKPSQLQIEIELKNGLIKQYRIIAGMAKSGFLISPLIENTAEFLKLYGEKGFLAGKLVKAIAIVPRDGRTSLWNDEYTVTFNQIKRPAPIDISKIYKLDGFDDELPASRITMAEK
ncbi:conserved membrane hypothetical protein [Candidatus Methylobacter favarea]|uniref:Transmembrane protein n=1 Tax=Candidatus Methylobacter favarea TaxID=2707345 RepID=A0A8S0Y9X4_9GAMM|nr:hypothetical protein [Candidatus Methylobacter favarea]CAA9890801.1 conserved membrane hypothetical protein [Candidatus Methylobacter favarea]